MNSWKRLIVCVIAVMSIPGIAVADLLLTGDDLTLAGHNVKIVAGACQHDSGKTFSINGKLIDGDAISRLDDSCTLDVRGYDYFVGTLGIQDDCEGWSGSVSFDLDGETEKHFTQKHRQNPTDVKVALAGHQSLRIAWNGNGVWIINPRLTKGNPSTKTPSVSSPEASAVFNSPAPFAVDPNDLDKLAQGIRKRVDADPGITERVAKGQIALMTFSLVDIPSTSVADNVAEDLSTAMVNNRFQLVERGQLDKVLKELKIQASGLIDPATIQKIGKLTGCDLILLGSVSDRGQFVVTNARLVETATGKALCAERVEMRKITITRQ